MGGGDELKAAPPTAAKEQAGVLRLRMISDRCCNEWTGHLRTRCDHELIAVGGVDDNWSAVRVPPTDVAGGGRMCLLEILHRR